jgi:hypothetical protein
MTPCTVGGQINWWSNSFSLVAGYAACCSESGEGSTIDHYKNWCYCECKTSETVSINPLNVELNPSCHLLVLLGDSKFMGPCIISIFQYTSLSEK